MGAGAKAPISRTICSNGVWAGRLAMASVVAGPAVRFARRGRQGGFRSTSSSRFTAARSCWLPSASSTSSNRRCLRRVVRAHGYARAVVWRRLSSVGLDCQCMTRGAIRPRHQWMPFCRRHAARHELAISGSRQHRFYVLRVNPIERQLGHAASVDQTCKRAGRQSVVRNCPARGSSPIRGSQPASRPRSAACLVCVPHDTGFRNAFGQPGKCGRIEESAELPFERAPPALVSRSETVACGVSSSCFVPAPEPGSTPGPMHARPGRADGAPPSAGSFAPARARRAAESRIR
jgi:hypothetical protein